MCFTPREQEILHLLAQHYTYREMCRELSISYGTLNSHLDHIVGKAGVRSQIKLVKYAQEHGYGLRYQAVLQEASLVISPEDMHNAFFTAYPDVLPRWNELTSLGKGIYRKAARELNDLLEKERRNI